MIGKAACRGAVTIVNAIACGKGAAFGITLETDVHSDLVNGEGPILVDGAEEGEELVGGCVRTVMDNAGCDLVHGKVTVRSDIPISRGLKSSSATTNAVVLSASRALGAELTDEDILNIAIDESIKAGVTVTGAFDDAAACFYGDMVVTDNAKRTILKVDKIDEGLEVVIHVPKRRISKADVSIEMFANHRSQFEEALRLALKGEYAAAMDLNSRLCSDVLDISNEIAETAKAKGAHAAGITGTGPATVVLCDRDRVQDMIDAFGEGDAEILRARLNHTCSREVVPRLL
ncbi:MAG: shikimate kinase [Methanobacteriota archaeon]|nr:MAG: shikimate kinase [Euryarchaeota archaeon]